jgi:endonuclease IV
VEQKQKKSQIVANKMQFSHMNYIITNKLNDAIPFPCESPDGQSKDRNLKLAKQYVCK